MYKQEIKAVAIVIIKVGTVALNIADMYGTDAMRL
jgi:hypothetical protein